MWIFCGGMQRSGSTLQYQIASELVETRGIGERIEYHAPADHDRVFQRHPSTGFKVFKSHTLTNEIRSIIKKNDGLVLYCFRDIRDVISSLKQKNAHTPFTLEYIEGLARFLVEQDTAWTQLPGIHISRYEDFVHDLEGEVSRIANHIGISIASETASRIASLFSILEQRKRIAAIRPDDAIFADEDNTYDPHSLLHRNHIHSGESGYFRTALSEAEQSAILRHAGDWLEARGYQSPVY